jgi:hypothetical protein
MNWGAPVELRVTNSHALFECPEELRCQGDGVGALDSGTGENVVQWFLRGRPLGQKLPIEIQHAQKSTELTGGLWSLTVLEMGHWFFQ